ncbi:MAG: M48 family metallopeptidase [Bacteroidales bacterium]|jgi:heat shock protein HtpX|nr:M48 family metallopeptidase [Bacteroidales bacterium]
MYELISKNKRKSWIVFFAMGLLLLILGGLIGALLDSEPQSGRGMMTGIIIATAVWALQSLIAITSGAQIVLRGMNAKAIDSHDDPVLYNVIEELSIASGLPLPKIYIIETPALNAFAAGTNPKKSLVAITRGLRQQLTRQEIQAVMAHELSHIYNRDVLYMTFASVMLGTIVLISDLLIRSFLWGGGRKMNKGSGPAQLIIIVAVIVLAILAPLFAQMFYFSLSRKREYLADTMAVNFTRDPNSLADALAKISGDTKKFDPGKMAAAMCISKPKLKSHKSSLFSTHPPIQKRIAILRAMSMGTDYDSYCAAYAQVMGKNDLPKSKK